MKEMAAKKERKIVSPSKQKIILLLAAGVTLGLTRSPRQYYRLVKAVGKEWRFINRQALKRTVIEFKYKRLIEYRDHPDGSTTIVLTEKGKHRALRLNIDNLKIQRPVRWDGKWRVVFFDVPEKKRAARDALRDKLKELGFWELQKSVFVHPFPCRDEIDFIVEFFEARNYVRYGEISKLTNEGELKLKFRLV